VAVATGMSLGAIGTDTGGSVRVPASLCGLVGYKPTYGLISRHGVMPLSWTIDTVGVITRTVEDAALLASSLMEPYENCVIAKAYSKPINCLHLGLWSRCFK
jgi:aspartyl-tRNA(Asn)/glutamyl-tRNA(Gln) amidotransferase subunit A